jgi:hypothetical protein
MIGKRVVAMDESIALLSDTGERLRDMAAKQDVLASQHLKNETRLEDVMRVAQSASDALTKPAADTKGPDMVKLLQALDVRLQSQAAAIAALSSQTRAAAAPRTDTAAVRKEVEAMLRQQKAVEAAKEAYIKIFADSLRLVKDQGFFAASSCSGHINSELFLELVQESLSRAKRRGKVLLIKGQPEDHPFPFALPEMRYLKFVYLQVFLD